MKVRHLTFSILVLYIANITITLAQMKMQPDRPGSGKIQQPGPECSLEKTVGTGNEKIEKFYFDRITRTCNQFFYYGKNGNLNNFSTKEKCNLRCICSQPLDQGQGTNSINQYFYNRDQNTCQMFSYRGNGGNENRFPSLADCKNICEPPATRSPCSRSRPDVGFNCNNNATTAFYYDKHCECCRQFTYLGCGGNDNLFTSLQICEQKCTDTATLSSNAKLPAKPSKPQICYYQALYGSCTDRLTRYYFDNVQGKCLSFTYSGCGGNENNFINLSTCKQTCG